MYDYNGLLMHLRAVTRRGMFVAACLLILAADFPWGDLQDHPHWSEVGQIPFVSGPLETRDLVGNVLLGVPAGMLTALSVTRPVLMAGVVTLPLSLAGEAMQIYSHERFPSATDVVLNVGGAMAAAFATAWMRRQHGRGGLCDPLR